MKKLVIAITGGSGYIGSSLAKHLSKNFNVKLLDISVPNLPLNSSLRFQVCDVRNFRQTKKCLEDVDVVIHASIIQIPLINNHKKSGFEVNIIGTQNVCKAVDEITKIKGLILSGSWHTIGEKRLKGVIDEEFGFKPDNVEERAKLYAFSKIAQEIIVRYYDEVSTKVFGIIKMGTVLGDDMPEKTAANIFIQNGLRGQPITPYSNSMFRPMLYVDIEDICRAYENFAKQILKQTKAKDTNSLTHVFNVYYPEVVTIFDLAVMTRNAITELTNNQIQPIIQIVKSKQPNNFNEAEKKLIKPKITKALNSLNLGELIHPQESIRKIVGSRIEKLDDQFHLINPIP